MSHGQNHGDGALSIVAPPVPRASFTINPKTYTGPRAEEVLQQRTQHLSAGQYHFYKKPLMLVEASMQYCFDDKGKVYVDGYSNVCHVGHCHPHFVTSCQLAMSNIISNTRYLHPTIGKYAEKLKAKLPSSLSVCYFVNSGSEANDLAMRLSRVHTKRHGVVCLEHAYHGTTASCTGVSTSLSTGTTKGTVDYQYCARDIHTVGLPDVYRGKHRGPDAGKKYAEQVLEVCQRQGDIAAFIHESVQGVGGQIVYPKDYLKRVYDHVHAEGGVIIADEVQTGFGRTGTHFWAFEAQGVVPDIVVMGKPIGNGFPLGAVVCTREIARSFDGVQYFNTNGGNPVACAAGLAVLEIIDRDGLQTNAHLVSQILMKGLQELKRKHAMIGDVRGVGLFVGIELIKDSKTLEPAARETAEVMERCRHFGLLVGKGGYLNNVIRMKPPLCFNKDDAEFAIRTLDVVIGEVERASRGGHLKVQDENHQDVYVNASTPGGRSSGADRRRVSMYDEREEENYDYEPLSASAAKPSQQFGDFKKIPRHLMKAVDQSNQQGGYDSDRATPRRHRYVQDADSGSDDDNYQTRRSNGSDVRRPASFDEDEGPRGRLSANGRGKRNRHQTNGGAASTDASDVEDYRPPRHSQNSLDDRFALPKENFIP